MRLAIVGAYGSGKTTLSHLLEQTTGLPRTQGTPMDRPLGGSGSTIATCSPAELVQLITKRFVERVLGEARQPGGFISDGSTVHEWVYGKVRLVAGSYPRTRDPLDARVRSPRTAQYEEVLDQVGLLLRQHAADAYDAFVHVPVEFPLGPGPQPISEAFRSLADELLLPALAETGIPVLTVRGDLKQRLSQVLEAFPLPVEAGIDSVLASPVV